MQQPPPTGSPQIYLRTRAVREEQERLDAEFARQLQEELDAMMKSGHENAHGPGGNTLSISTASPKVLQRADPQCQANSSGRKTPHVATLPVAIAASPLPSECEGPRSTRKSKQSGSRAFTARLQADAVLDALFWLHTCSPHQRHRSSHAAAATQPEPLGAGARINQSAANSAARFDSSKLAAVSNNLIPMSPHGGKENCGSVYGLSELDAIRIENEHLRESLASMRAAPSPHSRANESGKRVKPSLIDRLRCGIEALGCAASSSSASVASPFKTHHATKPEAFSGF